MKPPIRHIPALWGALLLTLLLLHPAAGQASDNMVIIIDGSNSMWAQMDQTHKIVAAREVLADLIETLPDKMYLGIVAYGHRRKGDCNDVEVLVELGPDNREQAVAAVEGLRPLGKTPLSLAVSSAADMLKGQNGRRMVLLVSDGEESCGQDPCLAVKGLLDQGLGFVMHVVGLAVSQDAEKQLKCMAEATGGEYISAGDADTLRNSLINALSKVR